MQTNPRTATGGAALPDMHVRKAAESVTNRNTIRCPLTAREGPYLLTCILEAGHAGMCLADAVIIVGREPDESL